MAESNSHKTQNESSIPKKFNGSIYISEDDLKIRLRLAGTDGWKIINLSNHNLTSIPSDIGFANGVEWIVLT